MVHDDRAQIEARIRRTIRTRIRPAIHDVVAPLEVTAWHVDGSVRDTPPTVDEARRRLTSGAFAPFAVGAAWGRPWSTTWFRLTGAIPDGVTPADLELHIDFGTGVGAGFQSEGLLHRTDGGGPIRGIHPFHRHVPVELVAGAGRGDLDVLVEAAANPVVAVSHEPTDLGDPDTSGDAPQYRLNAVDLCRRNHDVWHLDLDLQVLTGLLRELGADDPRRAEVLHGIAGALDRLDLHRVPATAGAARAALAPLLARRATGHAHRMSAVGHAHIDSAWLWPLRETRRKCVRTFSSAVALMDTYPEYRFVCSQAAQYDWVAQDQPELFDRIAARVADGRFIPVGSMWVEADANLPSGESLSRQLVWGRRFFRDRFGADADDGNRIVWIPDVFGYAGNLPQIMAAAGCEFFLTQKLSWNKTNRFPHHTFWWEGIDGTRIFTHFPPADTYNGEVVPRELAYAVRNFRDQGAASRSVYLFGHGDGGGGPTREMLERARRSADLDGLPRVEIESPVRFFERSRDEYADAPVWRGELYFEMHRGTYTSQARTKRGNRRGELALRELEVWSATRSARLGDPVPTGAVPTGDDSSDPRLLADLEGWWKTLLLHQFHDIIPGSSIAWVHDDTEADHAALLAAVEERTAGVLAELADGLTHGDAAVGGIVAANAGPFDVAAVIEGPDGRRLWADAPAFGAGTVSAALPENIAPVTLDDAGDDAGDGGVVLSNGLVTARIGPDGTLVSLVAHDAPGGSRECLAGPANVLQLFPDHPNEYDAWDLDAHTLALEPAELLDLDTRTSATDPQGMAGSVTVTRSFGTSTITQRYVLRAGSARLDIETDVDWHERERLLKAAFPLDVRADEARFDTQYGHVRRPTHRNTSWDAARFEVCSHFWSDLSEPDFGVALLDDGLYGGDVHESTVRLSLLRAANYPDPHADEGHHRFTYAVFPHGSSLAPVVHEAWALNLPPRLVPGAPMPPLVRCDHPGVVLTAVKEADDGSGDLVVRGHEALGGRARATLVVSGGRTVAECDLLEVPTSAPEPVAADGLAVELRPFELGTWRFTLA